MPVRAGPPGRCSTTELPTGGVEGFMPGDRRMTEDEAVAELRSGMTIGTGGWGSTRKPMSLGGAILRSDVHELTVVWFGGRDVGLLCAARKVWRLVYGFVSLDTVALNPYFR